MQRDWKIFWASDAVRDAIERDRQLRDLLSSPYHRVLTQFEEYRRLVDSTQSSLVGLRYLEEANSKLAGIVKMQMSFPKEKSAAFQVNIGWMAQAKSIRLLFEGEKAIAMALQSQTLRMAELSIAAETMFSQIQHDKLAACWGVTENLRSELSGHLEAMARSYAALVQSFSPSVVVDLPYFASQVPSEEMLHAAHLALSCTTATWNESQDSEAEELQDSVCADKALALESMLADLDPSLPHLLNGAKISVHSSNPDKVRHVLTSLRELITHVLHKLAPDNQVRAWSNMPEHYHDGKPTRSARLLYIAHSVNHGPLNEFFEADVSANLKFIAVCNEGTHTLEGEHSEAQLNAMICRTEGLLYFLLSMGRTNR